MTTGDTTTMPTLHGIVNKYYEFRGYRPPKAEHALLFLVSEIGELTDAAVHGQATWVRNNPEKERSITDEIGDVMMMLTVYAAAHGTDPVGCMLDKMRKKGFEPYYQEPAESTPEAETKSKGL